MRLIHSLNANMAIMVRTKPNIMGLKKTSNKIKKLAKKSAVIVLLNITFF